MDAIVQKAQRLFALREGFYIHPDRLLPYPLTDTTRGATHFDLPTIRRGAHRRVAHRIKAVTLLQERAPDLSDLCQGAQVQCG
jgi:hypothetical protein